MAKNSSIEWTDHTFNPWWGCTKVSPGCANCYAESWSKRIGRKLWGPTADRRFFTEKHWGEPLVWNRDARAEGNRKRVFCASMADVFESRAELDSWRERLWTLVEATPMLDWLLLTKRPQNIGAMVPWGENWPSNVWLGTTVEDQERANERLPLLLKHAAKCRFLSCEPLVAAVNLEPWLNERPKDLQPINWVIAGGESGHKARPMLPGWARRLRDQCSKASVPFHFKQWGHWAPVYAKNRRATSAEGFWDEVSHEEILMEPLGKHGAGRHLDGVTWDELPLTA